MYKVDEYLRVRRAVMVDGMSMRETARTFGLHRDTVRKMLAYSVPPGYRRQTPPRRPKLKPYTGVIDRILEDDLRRPRKQRHTAKRIFERLGDEYGFDGRYTTVKDYVRENRRQTREMFVPLSHPPGHAQCDFGEALVVIGGVEQKAHCFVIDLPHSDGCFVKAYPAETRTIAKSVSSTVEAGDGLRWAEGASLGSQGQGHPGWKPSFQAQDVQTGVDQGGEYLAQPRTAQRVDVLIPTAVLHVMQAVLNAPVVAEQPEQFLRLALPGTQAGQQIPTLPAHLPGG